MLSMPYDSSRASLFSPGDADDFFGFGNLPSEAALCAEMMRLAYVKEVDRLEQYLARNHQQSHEGFILCKTVGYGSGGTQAFVAIEPSRKIAVVAFRGTEPDDPSDLFADARFTFSDWQVAGQTICKVHDGFKDALDEASFQTLMAAIPADAKRVLFTGHSLGGALASLAASRFSHVDHLYTFGSPRVGDQNFANYMAHVNHSRFMNCCDIVTTVPPPLFGYHHFGTQHYIDRFGRVTITPDDDFIVADRVAAEAEYQFKHALLFGRLASRTLADHTPINYLSATMGLRV